MRVVKSAREMQLLSDEFRRDNFTIGFVPTMGALHEGHLSLMRTAAKEADKVVISIFVNPTQFAPTEDLSNYPRDFNRDESLAADAGVDVIFYPSEAEIYPEGYDTYTSVEKLSQRLEGATRPTHFRGVTTIVNKLFNIVKPHSAYFGQKDAQQAILIKRMTLDLCLNIKIGILPIIRESDGLAMSSRNAYLTADERSQAVCLHNSLVAAQRLHNDGNTDAGSLQAEIESIISESALAQIDYVAIVDPDTLLSVEKTNNGALIPIAVFFGKTRLIDNVMLDPKK